MVQETPGRSDPDIAIYLPWPLYNSDDLLDLLLDQKHSVGVGKWLKKGLDQNSVALITCTVSILLTPIWSGFYKDVLYPKLKAQWPKLQELLSRNVSIDFQQKCEYPLGNSVSVYFIPDRGNEAYCLSELLVVDGMRTASDAVVKLTNEKGKLVRRVRLVFSPATASYAMCEVEFDDGDSLYFGDT